MTCYIDSSDPTTQLHFDALLPYVQPSVIGCPDEIVIHNIRLATIEFCRRTGILHDVRKYDLQQDVGNYGLETVCDYSIISVFRVTVNGTYNYTPVNVKLPSKVSKIGFTFYMDSPTCLNLNTVPSSDQPEGLEVETIVVPKQDACVLEKYLYENWAEEIASGAMYRLLSIPNTSWKDLMGAKDANTRWRQGLNRARAAIDKAFANNGLMKAPPMVSGGGRWAGGIYSWNPNAW